MVVVVTSYTLCGSVADQNGSVCKNYVKVDGDSACGGGDEAMVRNCGLSGSKPCDEARRGGWEERKEDRRRVRGKE